MRALWLIVIFALCILSGTGCDCQGNEECRLLAASDAIICTDPDSSLKILDSVDCGALDDFDRAWYGLLRTKATDKSGRLTADDSLIRFAVDYFDGRGDSLEVQLLFYFGVVQYAIVR